MTICLYACIQHPSVLPSREEGTLIYYTSRKLPENSDLDCLLKPCNGENTQTAVETSPRHVHHEALLSFLIYHLLADATISHTQLTSPMTLI